MSLQTYVFVTVHLIPDTGYFGTNGAFFKVILDLFMISLEVKVKKKLGLNAKTNENVTGGVILANTEESY